MLGEEGVLNMFYFPADDGDNVKTACLPGKSMFSKIPFCHCDEFFPFGVRNPKERMAV